MYTSLSNPRKILMCLIPGFLWAFFLCMDDYGKSHGIIQKQTRNPGEINPMDESPEKESPEKERAEKESPEKTGNQTFWMIPWLFP
jgi:hypothetical protein